MSQKNVEVIRRLFEAYSRGDVESAVQNLHPEVEVHPALEPVERVGRSRGAWRGREQVTEFFNDLDDTWEQVTVEVEDTVKAGGDRVVATEKWRVRGRNGIEVDTRLFEIYTFRDGLISRVDGFTDKADALEAAGLSE